MLVRGAYDQKADKVTHGVPSVLPALQADAPQSTGAGPVVGRTRTPPDCPGDGQPLLANTFRRRTGENSRGFRLARRAPFTSGTARLAGMRVAHRGWDVKRLLRLIMTSATYRQSSRLAPALAQRDPDNRLLARGPRYRLPSWMIRDQALAIGGLSGRADGRPAGEAVSARRESGKRRRSARSSTSRTTEQALYRRSLYQFWRRIVGPTVFFDVAPAGRPARSKSAPTNTPLHALRHAQRRDLRGGRARPR